MYHTVHIPPPNITHTYFHTGNPKPSWHHSCQLCWPYLPSSPTWLSTPSPPKLPPSKDLSRRPWHWSSRPLPSCCRWHQPNTNSQSAPLFSSTSNYQQPCQLSLRLVPDAHGDCRETHPRSWCWCKSYLERWLFWWLWWWWISRMTQHHTISSMSSFFLSTKFSISMFILVQLYSTSLGRTCDVHVTTSLHTPVPNSHH